MACGPMAFDGNKWPRHEGSGSSCDVGVEGHRPRPIRASNSDARGSGQWQPATAKASYSFRFRRPTATACPGPYPCHPACVGCCCVRRPKATADKMPETAGATQHRPFPPPATLQPTATRPLAPLWRLKVLVWFWRIDETLCANLFDQV
jgi:hypothetical protein